MYIIFNSCLERFLTIVLLIGCNFKVLNDRLLYYIATALRSILDCNIISDCKFSIEESLTLVSLMGSPP